MTIREAIFKNNVQEKTIKVSDISSKKEYQEQYRSMLFCTEPNCNARITFNESPKRGNFFSTWDNDEHDVNCKYYYGKAQVNNPQSTEKVLTSLSDDHIKSIFYRTSTKNRGGKTNSNLTNTSSTNQRVNKSKQVKDGINYIASVNPEAEAIKVTREKPISSRDCNDIIKDDNGKSLSVYGTVCKVELFDDLINYIYNTDDGKVVKVQFFTPFKTDNNQAYNALYKIGEYINSHQESLDLNCVGLIKHKDSEIIIHVFEQRCVRINDNVILLFLNKLSNNQ